MGTTVYIGSIFGTLIYQVLTRFDFEKNEWTSFNITLGKEISSLMQTSDGAVWMGTSGGLARFDYGKDQWTVFSTDNSGLPGSVLSLVQASDGALWVGTLYGLVRFDYEKNQWIIFNTVNSGLPNDN